MKTPLIIALILLFTAAPLVGILVQNWEGFYAAVLGIIFYLGLRFVIEMRTAR